MPLSHSPVSESLSDSTLDADGSYTIAAASSVLTLAFGGTMSGLGTVTANLSAANYTFASMAAEIQSKLRSTLLAGTASQAELASRVTVTGTASGAGSTLSVRIEGVSSGASVTLAGGSNAVTLLSAVAVNVTQAGQKFQVGSGITGNEQISFGISGTSSTALSIASISINTDDTTTNAAITALENGEALDDELAGILDAAVTKLRTERDDVAANLAIKQKQLDVLLARV